MGTKLIADEVRNGMWDRTRPAVAEAANLFLRVGVKPAKGQSKQDALVEVIMDLLRDTYLGGLEHGYEMAKHVFAGPDLVGVSDSELADFRLAKTILEGVVASMPGDKNARRALAIVSELVRVRGREPDDETVEKTDAEADDNG